MLTSGSNNFLYLKAHKDITHIIITMGYETYFKGEFQFNKPLSAAHNQYLQIFCNTRRMKRDPNKLRDYTIESDDVTLLEDYVRLAAGLPSPGIDGEYFIGRPQNCGQDKPARLIATGSDELRQHACDKADEDRP